MVVVVEGEEVHGRVGGSGTIPPGWSVRWVRDSNPDPNPNPNHDPKPNPNQVDDELAVGSRVQALSRTGRGGRVGEAGAFSTRSLMPNPNPNPNPNQTPPTHTHPNPNPN